MDHAVLRLVKYGDEKAARRLQAISLGLAASAHSAEEQTFWMVSAAYFEGMALRLFDGDVYTKRAASRILQQYVALAKGQHYGQQQAKQKPHQPKPRPKPRSSTRASSFLFLNLGGVTATH